MVGFESKYAYSVARIRVLETRLLDRAKVERMVEARDAEDAFKVLSETEYAPALARARGPREYEKALGEEVKRVYSLIREISPNQNLVNLLLLKYDFHNLKVLLKARFRRPKPGVEEGEEALIDFGWLPGGLLRSAVEAGNPKDLPEPHLNAVEEAILAYKETMDPQRIDIAIDVAMYAFFEVSTRKEDRELTFLSGFFRRESDLINLRTFLRVKAGGQSEDFLRRVLLPGGSIDRDIFVRVLREPVEVITEILARSDYGEAIEEGIKHWAKSGSLSHLDRLADSFLIAYLRRAKYVPFGPEPLVAYVLAKENEVKVIRIIMVGKINGLSKDDIKERLRDVYA